MLGTIPLPTPEPVRELLDGLLGRVVSVGTATRQAVDAGPPMVTGVYATDEGTVAALCLYDLTLAASAGAALTLVPPGVVAEAARSGVLPEMLMEHTREILNVSARLFNSDRTPHVRLREVCPTVGALPDDAAVVLAVHRGRVDYEVRIPQYGDGRMVALTG